MRGVHKIGPPIKRRSRAKVRKTDEAEADNWANSIPNL